MGGKAAPGLGMRLTWLREGLSPRQERKVLPGIYIASQFENWLILLHPQPPLPVGYLLR